MRFSEGAAKFSTGMKNLTDRGLAELGDAGCGATLQFLSLLGMSLLVSLVPWGEVETHSEALLG